MTATIVKPALVRIVVLLVALLVYEALVPTIFADSTDALGPGLLEFLGLFVVAGLWALVDSHRASRTGTVLLLWLVVAAVIGVEEGVRLAFRDFEGWDDVLLDDLAAIPFFTILIWLPASLGAVLGIIGRRPAAA